MTGMDRIWIGRWVASVLPYPLAPLLLRLTGVGLAAMALGGCMSAAEKRLVAEGKTQPYIDGYEDGCESGRAISGPHRGLDAFVQDLVRFQFQPGYAEGWNAGLGDCKTA